jgi:hypothetical protein
MSSVDSWRIVAYEEHEIQKVTTQLAESWSAGLGRRLSKSKVIPSSLHSFSLPVLCIMSTQPLLPTHRSLSKGKGKAPAPPSPSSSSGSSTPPRKGFRAFDHDDDEQEEDERGRCVTIRFTGDGGGDLDVWVEEGESVGSVKEKVSSVFRL